MRNTYEIFMDWGSQPSRAVMTVAYLLNIPHTIREVRILKSQNKTEEYKKINPDQKIPCIIENQSFILNESHAIMRYFCLQQEKENQLYPQNDMRKRAQIDSYLDWHHSNTRIIHKMIFKKLFEEQLGVVTTVSQQELDSNVQNVLQYIENNYLSSQDQFLLGFDSFTLADISAFCEIAQTKVLDFNFQPYPNISQWMLKMAKIPQIKQSHSVYYQLLEKRKQKLISKL